MGGLGNQLFQYAMAKNIIESKKCKLLLDDTCGMFDSPRKFELNELNICGIKTISPRLSRKYNNYRRYCDAFMNSSKIDKNKTFSSKIFRYGFEREEFVYQDNSNYNYLDGYWQNTKYFYKIKSILNNEFSYKWNLSDIQEKYLFRINSTNSVGVHIRRGDYLNLSNYYEVLDNAYYAKAIDYINEIIIDPVFFIFSDDINWCKQNFKGDNFIFTDSEINTNAKEDFEMLKKCKHHIISNSTFSWWASWLSMNDKNITIAPSKWYKNDEQNRKCQKALLDEMILF